MLSSADDETQQQVLYLHHHHEHGLKYLGFFPLALTSACLYLSSVYEAMKDQAGPLKPGVEDVEDMIKIVMGPVIKIAGNNSTKLLDFVDKKVDEKLKLVEERMPDFVRPMANQALKMFLPTQTTETCSTAQTETSGAHGTGDSFLRFVAVPFSPCLMMMVAPHALYSIKLFNSFSSALKERHFPFSAYIPVIPVQAVERAVKRTTEAQHKYKCCGYEDACL